MKKDQRLTTSHIMRRLHEGDLYYFSPVTLAALLDVPITKAYEILRRLKAEDLVRPVEAGKYLLLGFQPERVFSNPMFIATRLAHPAYVSYWNALHFHGLTEQVPRTVFVATTRKHRPLDFDSARFVFVRVAPHKFFGYQREVIGDLPVLIADIEKALVDSLDQPRYAGGLPEVAKALYQAREQLDEEQLVAYANRMRNRSLCSRLGYLLERLGQPFDYAQGRPFDYAQGRPFDYAQGRPFDKASTEPALPALDGRPGSLSKGSTQRLKAPPLAGLEVSQTFVRLDPQAKVKGPYDHRWRVQVNVSDEELFRWRES